MLDTIDITLCLDAGPVKMLEGATSFLPRLCMSSRIEVLNKAIKIKHNWHRHEFAKMEKKIVVAEFVKKGKNALLL